MTDRELQSTIEAILFAAGEPMPAERLALVTGEETERVLECARQLADEYSFTLRGIRLVRTGDRLQLCSAPEYADDVIHALEKRRPAKLSQSSLEALAVCAYFQPVTRAYVEQVRGVDSSYTMGVLLERGLIEECGKLDAPGRPVLFRTSDLFLRTMGITELSQLPKLPDMSTDEGAQQLEGVIEALKAQENDGGSAAEAD